MEPHTRDFVAVLLVYLAIIATITAASMGDILIGGIGK